MKYIDYRELLGIGFSDEEKGKMLKNKILILINNLRESQVYNPDINRICKKYFMEVGEIPSGYYNLSHVYNSFESTEGAKEILSKAVVFGNIYDSYFNNATYTVIGAIKQFLSDLNIIYETVDDENRLFIIPGGAKELDEGLINEPLQWLSDYPLARTAMLKALKAYSDNEDPSNIADYFRKGLETFFKAFLNTDKPLEKVKNEYGKYMKSKGVPSDLSNSFETILGLYKNFMNDNAKHNDRVNKKWLEFIMYQTFNIIRFVVMLGRE